MRRLIPGALATPKPNATLVRYRDWADWRNIRPKPRILCPRNRLGNWSPAADRLRASARATITIETRGLSSTLSKSGGIRKRVSQAFEQRLGNYHNGAFGA